MILQYPDQLLRTSCKKADNHIENIRVARALDKAMHNHNTKRQCIGLAANQIGAVFARVFVLDKELHETGIFVNPFITGYGKIRSYMEESCMSFAETISVDVLRYKEIRLEYFDLAMFRHQEIFTGLAAQAIQHELDHLNGMTLYELGSDKDRKKIRRLQDTELEEISKDSNVEFPSRSAYPGVDNGIYQSTGTDSVECGNSKS